MKKKEKVKVCLVGSSGGHLTHLHMLKPLWKDWERFWVTFDKTDANSLLQEEKVYHCFFPTNRNIKNLIKNTFLAIKVLIKEKPDLIISSGAAVAVPLSAFHARTSLWQRPLYSRALMSNDTVNSSPAWMLNCAILSAPNTLKQTFFGYCSCVSITYSCVFHSFPVFDTPPLSGSTAMIFPVISIIVFKIRWRK